MKKLLDNAKNSLKLSEHSQALLDKGQQALRSGQEMVNDGLSTVKEMVNGLPIFVSLTQSSNYQIEYDEKHYFVIPYRFSQTGFSLHTMRCLPKNVNEVNDLPKRRVFHFANEHAEGTLKQFMLETARDMTERNSHENISSLESLANDIDALDNKLTYGILVVGGLAAIVNPLVGAAIAAKAVVPGVGVMASKYALRPLGEKQTQASVDKAVEQAQQKVMEEFTHANTVKVINPILQELELALNTTEAEHDPLLDPNLSDGSLPELDSERWRELTQNALYQVYKEVYHNPKKHKEADLGPEDIRWLKVMFEQDG